MNKIIKNAIRCKHCGDEIESTHIHDFKTCSCGRCSVDGGHSYLKRSFKESSNDFEEISIVEHESERTIENKGPKYKCPHCGSVDISIAEETLTRRVYSISKNGERFKLPANTIEHYTDYKQEYYLCNHCYAEVDLNDSEVNAWIVED